MNKRRLLKLADLLEADAKNKKGVRFDLSTWGENADGQSAELSCGTNACAMGLAVLSGAFKRAGLRNRIEGSSYIEPAMPGGLIGWSATRELFGIDHGTAEFLFADKRYPDDKRSGAAGERFVAKRIRNFVAGKVAAG